MYFVHTDVQGNEESPVFLKALLLSQKYSCLSLESCWFKKKRGPARLVVHYVKMEIRSELWNAVFHQASSSIEDCIANDLKRAGSHSPISIVRFFGETPSDMGFTGRLTRHEMKHVTNTRRNYTPSIF